MLIAPCRFHQQVSTHRSAVVTELKADIRTRLASGQTRDDIRGA